MSMKYFFLLILLVPILAQAYVTWRLWALLPLPVWGKVVVSVALAAAFALFFCSVLPLLDRFPMTVSSVIYHIGTSWLMILLYLFMLFVLLDLLRLCHLVPTTLLHDSWRGTLAVLATIAVLFTYGYFHYLHKERVALPLQTAKPLASPLRIVMTSDWHLGYHNRRSELARWIDLINAEQPDLVLIAGDIIDRSQRPLRDEHMADEFHRLTAPVYACLGNHEYISGVPGALDFYREAGIHLLQDSVATVGDIVIIGRDDRMRPRRKPLDALMAGVPKDKYLILLDHQPYHLEEAEAAGIDFELAGHTHHGQLWPVSWITDALYECAFGPHQRGATRYYVSSGLGIWGGKFRIGTRSEYIVADIH